MFENVIKRSGTRSRGGNHCGRETENSLGFASYNKSKNNTRGHVTFAIGNNLLKKARFVVGDRIAILHDAEAKLGLLRRIPADEFNNGNLITKSTAKTYLQLQAQYLPCFPKPNGGGIRNLDNVVVNDEGILFAWPE